MKLQNLKPNRPENAFLELHSTFKPSLKTFLGTPMTENKVWATYLIIKRGKKIANTFYFKISLSPPRRDIKLRYWSYCQLKPGYYGSSAYSCYGGRWGGGINKVGILDHKDHSKMSGIYFILFSKIIYLTRYTEQNCSNSINRLSLVTD